jgi:hypothetical protein
MNGHWGNCAAGCPVDDSCIVDSGPAAGKECVLPFTYNGVTYNECTDVGTPGKLWCSIVRSQAQGLYRSNPIRNRNRSFFIRVPSQISNSQPPPDAIALSMRLLPRIHMAQICPINEGPEIRLHCSICLAQPLCSYAALPDTPIRSTQPFQGNFVENFINRAFTPSGNQ